MLRLCLSVLLVGLFSGTLKSQAKENHYLIKPYAFADKSLADITSALSSITGANSISYNAIDSTFSVSTYRVLDKTVVTGKMLKNYFPLKSILNLDHDDPYPVIKHTADEKADADLYEQQKTAWIKRHPDDYKKMNEHK